MGKHSHNYHEIVVVMWSKEKVSTGEDTIEASEGDILVFRPGVMHEEWSGDNPPLETVFFSFSSGSLPAEIPLKVKDTKGRLRIIATWMLSESRILRQHESSSLMNSYMDAFLAEMTRIVRHRESPLVENIRSMIMRDPAKDHSLESLAKSACLSKFHFLRKYRQLAGVSPADDVRRIRLSFAKDLLISTDEPLKSIAEESGLSNETTLCRLFQRYYKKSPGKFRK
jgi:AraC-like DNA-binding protein